MTGDMLKGHLELVVLAALDGKTSHGYAVIEEIRRRSGGTLDLPEGTVYPVLHRLEEANLLSSRWDDSSGRKRRMYTLTSAGRRGLADRRNLWSRFVAAVSSFASPAAAKHG